jgi:hypothetical protein
MELPCADHLAGVCDEWKNCETRQRIKSCEITIIERVDFVAEVHDHMPSEGETNMSDTENTRQIRLKRLSAYYWRVTFDHQRSSFSVQAWRFLPSRSADPRRN